MSERLDLWDESRDISMLALGHLISESDGELEEEPMIIVADLEDPLGAEITQLLSGALDDEEATGMVVTDHENKAILILPVELVRQTTGAMNPALARELAADAPEDLMWAAVVSGGGITLLQVPIEPLIAVGSA